MSPAANNIAAIDMINFFVTILVKTIAAKCAYLLLYEQNSHNQE